MAKAPQKTGKNLSEEIIVAGSDLVESIKSLAQAVDA